MLKVCVFLLTSAGFMHVTDLTTWAAIKFSHSLLLIIVDYTIFLVIHLIVFFFLLESLVFYFFKSLVC
jgi:hypothetical protein